MLVPWPLSASPFWERGVLPCWEMGAFLYGFPTCVWRAFSDRRAANCQEDPRANVASASRQEAWVGREPLRGVSTRPTVRLCWDMHGHVSAHVQAHAAHTCELVDGGMSVHMSECTCMFMCAHCAHTYESVGTHGHTCVCVHV